MHVGEGGDFFTEIPPPPRRSHCPLPLPCTDALLLPFYGKTSQDDSAKRPSVSRSPSAESRL